MQVSECITRLLVPAYTPELNPSANVSTHGFLIAGSIMAAHLLGVLKNWKRFDKRTRVDQLAAAALLAVVGGLVVLVLLPPSDLTFARESHFGVLNFIKVSTVMVPRSLTVDYYSVPELLGAQPWPHRECIASTVVSLIVLIITLWWLRRRRTLLLYVLPLTALLALFAIKWHNVWHEGILFFLWLFALWVSFDKRDESDNDESLRVSRSAMLAAMVVVLIVHVYWAACSFRYDFYHTYSGSYDVAQYVKANHLENAKIYATGYKSTAILPYFDNNIFENFNNGAKPRFWFWSTQNKVTEKDATADSAKDVAAIEKLQPDVVIFASGTSEPQKPVTINGYQLAGTFNGELCWKTKPFENKSYLVCRKKDSLPDATKSRPHHSAPPAANNAVLVLRHAPVCHPFMYFL